MKSLALAYNMKRKAKKAKKMAEGGEAETEEAPATTTSSGPNLPGAQSAQSSMRKAFKFAKGGEAGAMEEDDKDLNEQPVDMKQSTEDADDDLVMRIMRKRYSKGGQVANEGEDRDLVDFDPNEFDDLALNDDLEFHDTGANSGDELGNEQEDEDRKDIVSRIMASRKKKDRLPSPA